MGEIKNKIVKLEENVSYKAGPDEYLVTEDHSIADITRWLIENDWHEEVIYMLSHDSNFERM